MLRNEAALANIAWLVGVQAGIKNKSTNLPFPPEHFAPWTLDAEEPITLQEAMKQWK